MNTERARDSIAAAWARGQTRRALQRAQKNLDSLKSYLSEAATNLAGDPYCAKRADQAEQLIERLEGALADLEYYGCAVPAAKSK